MEWKTVSVALGVMLLGLLGAFWVAVETRDQMAITSVDERLDLLTNEHLELRARVRTLEQKLSALQERQPSPQPQR